MYQFATLDPRDPSKVPAAAAANDAVFRDAISGVYGVEVTVPSLAARCALGNLDPQHTGGQNIAACVAALDCELPIDGATVATVRADADSVLAMAVLAMRVAGDGGLIDHDKATLIGAADSAPAGPWVRDYSPPPAFAAMNAVAMDHRTPMQDRVMRAVRWLCGLEELSKAEPTDHSAVEVTVAGGGRYAIARADGPAGRGAIAAGYRLAPVVIAANEKFSLRGEPEHRKYTVARWNATHVPMDWAGLKAELQGLEAGWGGSDSIIGSSQGTASPLTLEQVVAVVGRHIYSDGGPWCDCPGPRREGGRLCADCEVNC